MRITGGTLRGREIRVPGGAVRPTQDKVRAAIFSALGGFAAGARTLDLFAGSGALGLEAWSRGAADVCWVERDRRVLAVLQDNVRRLCPDGGTRAQCRAQDAFRFLAQQAAPPAGGAPAAAGRWDLVLADPPYDRTGTARWLEKTLPALEAGSMLRSGGLLVFEAGADEPPVARPGWSLLWDRTYGGTRVAMYRREAPAPPPANGTESG